MSEVKEIRISGFRGIKTCLKLQFLKCNAYQSMVIYGRNGTGKSSITDAWELIQTEKIEHLRREGAGNSAYPHKYAQKGDSFIEVDFVKSSIGTIRLEYDFDRVTKFIQSGNLDTFRSLAPHPCFIRFEDLTRFVILTKTERFDALARLMGFVPQVEMQKSLRRVVRNFQNLIDALIIEINEISKQLIDIIKVESFSASDFLLALNEILNRNKISMADSITGLEEKARNLNELVINDPNAKRLSHLKSILGAINLIKKDDDFLNHIGIFTTNAKGFLSAEHDFSKLLLLELYEHGEKIISQTDSTGNKIFVSRVDTGEIVDNCPLCGQQYKGDLLTHIKNEIEILRKLKEERDELERQRKDLIKKLPQKGGYILSFEFLGADQEVFVKELSLNALSEKSAEIGNAFQHLSNQLNFSIDQLSSDLLKQIGESTNVINTKKQAFITELSNITNILSKLIAELESNNEYRKNLVTDNTNFSFARKLWGDLENKRKHLSDNEKTFQKTNAIVDDYVQSSIANVENRFKIISNDVRDFFELLEHDTDGLSGATIKLLTDEDRAVELQVDFHGDQIYPAYKYLSESQLNSFGLSVFLASVKYFNSDFKFIILDDIINSFDGYKRPRICELLKTKFPAHQVLLLTHDNVWSDKLFESFPSAVKKRFTRWEINHGPIDMEAVAPLDEIIKLIDEDKPSLAGALLGPFLERQIQEICEKFEVFVKYSRINEYSLNPLIDRLRIRAKEKLGDDHCFVKAIQDLYDDTGFRNLCSHWKNPDIQLTKEEMQAVVNKWLEVEKLAKCQSDDCLDWLVYDATISGFVCPCGKSSLEKLKGQS